MVVFRMPVLCAANGIFLKLYYIPLYFNIYNPLCFQYIQSFIRFINWRLLVDSWEAATGKELPGKRRMKVFHLFIYTIELIELILIFCYLKFVGTI